MTDVTKITSASLIAAEKVEGTNVYNLADKQYVQAINKSGYRYTPGAPRSASLTANFKF